MSKNDWIAIREDVHVRREDVTAFGKSHWMGNDELNPILSWVTVRGGKDSIAGTISYEDLTEQLAEK